MVRLPHQGPDILGGAHRLGLGEAACTEAGEQGMLESMTSA